MLCIYFSIVSNGKLILNYFKSVFGRAFIETKYRIFIDTFIFLSPYFLQCFRENLNFPKNVAVG